MTPPLSDALVAAAFVAAVLLEAAFSDTARQPFVHALLSVPAMAALAWRRRFPVAVATVIVVSNLAINPEAQFSTLLALVLASFSIGAEVESPRSWLGLAIIVIPFLAASTLEGLEPSDVAAAIVFLGGPWTVGVGTRQRAARAAEAMSRADRLEQEQAAQAAAAVEAERTRIARELHDIVSHSLSIVTIQTQAVRRRLGAGQEREAQDLAVVETTARQALAEMRRLFGVLRVDGETASRAPQPGLGQLNRLVEHVRSAGMPVELRIRGERLELPPGVDLAAYRVVQEGLTNALRHAGARRAVVALAYAPTIVRITIDDDGRGAGDLDASTSGHGLLGIRERVALYGGSVETGKAPLGGFRLSVLLPVGEPQ